MEDSLIEGPVLAPSATEMAGFRVPRLVDTACQTEAVQMPMVPLPLSYPANLIYAQNMLAITLNQMHQLDLNIAQLRFHLCEHEVRAVAAAVLASGSSGKAVASTLLSHDAGAAAATLRTTTSSSGEQTRDSVQEPGPDAVEAARAANAPGGRPAAAAAAGAQPARPADGEPLRQHRRRLAAAVKIALMMILLEFRAGWFFLYFFAVFMYIGGLFDPFIEWFQRPTAQATLEQQLSALRNRQRRAAEQAAAEAAAPAAALPPADVATPGAEGGEGGETAAPEGGSTAEEQAAGLPGSETAAAGAEAAADPAAAEGRPQAPSSGGPDAAAGAGAVAEAQRPPWAHRFIYQLLVMFFMTLLPWWNPDPRYL